ncbi:hypothetical protein TrLO_g9472, partial [Triparma laevis f. longispina]
LVRPEVQLDCCLSSGTFFKLKLKGDGRYAKWSGNPTITITHHIDEDSPFFDKRDEAGEVISTVKGVVHVSCSLVGTDSFGNHITEVQQYSNTEVGFQKMMLDPYFTAGRITDKFGDQLGREMNLEDLCPSIISNTKFEDQITFGEVKVGDERRGVPSAWKSLLYPNSGATLESYKFVDKEGKGFVPKRLITDSDTFCRIVPIEQGVGGWKASEAKDEEAIEKEKRLTEARAKAE